MMKRIAAIAVFTALSAASMLAANAKNGNAVYDKACKTCHGSDGTANPAIVTMMKVPINDLKSADVQGLADPALKAIVTDGKGKMKPVKTVTGADLDDVVAFVHTLKK
jgi:mono/diheme cytochrome c family protein